MNNMKLPQKWHENKLAGIEWLYSLRKRYPNISLRTPEGCSLSRATSFNRHNVKMFFDQCLDKKYSAMESECTYNLDETNTTIVQNSAKVLKRQLKDKTKYQKKPVQREAV